MLDDPLCCPDSPTRLCFSFLSQTGKCVATVRAALVQCLVTLLEVSSHNDDDEVKDGRCHPRTPRTYAVSGRERVLGLILWSGGPPLPVGRPESEEA